MSIVTDPGARGPSGSEQRQDLAGRADWGLLRALQSPPDVFRVQGPVGPGSRGPRV